MICLGLSLFLVFGLIAVVYVFVGIAWVENVSKKYYTYVDEPWREYIDKFCDPEFRYEDRKDYSRLAEFVIKEYDRSNPTYWYRNWNKGYFLNDIEKS